MISVPTVTCFLFVMTTAANKVTGIAEFKQRRVYHIVAVDNELLSQLIAKF